MMLFIREHLPETAFSPFALAKARLPCKVHTDREACRRGQASSSPMLSPLSLYSSQLPDLGLHDTLSCRVSSFPGYFEGSVTPHFLPFPSQLDQDCSGVIEAPEAPFLSLGAGRLGALSFKRAFYSLPLFKPDPLTPTPGPAET